MIAMAMKTNPTTRAEGLPRGPHAARACLMVMFSTAVVGVAVGCNVTKRGPRESMIVPRASSAREIEVTSLASSIAPLKQAFNVSNGKYRFVALLSPT
jgi:hypothetical protein